MPESLMDCCVLISDRLRPKQKLRFEMADYKATLGWIMTFKKEEAATIPPLTKDQELLTEIRDLLKAGKQ